MSATRPPLCGCHTANRQGQQAEEPWALSTAQGPGFPLEPSPEFSVQHERAVPAGAAARGSDDGRLPSVSRGGERGPRAAVSAQRAMPPPPRPERLRPRPTGDRWLPQGNVAAQGAARVLRVIGAHTRRGWDRCPDRAATGPGDTQLALC